MRALNSSLLEDYAAALAGIDTWVWSGRVREVVGLLVVSDGPAAGVGAFCDIYSSGNRIVRAQVVGFREGRVLLMPLEETCLLYTSPSPRDPKTSRMPSSA